MISSCGVQKKEIESLIVQLGDEDKDIASKAADKLASIGKPAVPALIQALSDEDVHVRYYATSALCDIGSDAKAATPALAKTLLLALKDWWKTEEDEHEKLRINVDRALKSIGGVEELKAVIADMLIPLVKDATIFELNSAERPSITGSYFGGTPYAEEGDTWPICPGCSNPLDFICQVNFEDCVHETPPRVGLFTFIYCWECFPQDSDDLSWVVRIYSHPSEQKSIMMTDIRKKSNVLLPLKAKAVKLLNGSRDVAMLCQRVNSAEPWNVYNEIAEKITGTDMDRYPIESESIRIGGYPWWVQEGYTPECPQCSEQMEFLAQINSEPYMWGDVGCVYLFICREHLSEIRFELQSH